MRFLYLLLSLAIPCSAEDEQKILDWDALNSEAGVRRAVEDAFPSLSFGFYHWTGTWIIGALEDFDQRRILLLLPTEGVGEAKFARNGTEQELPPGKPVTLRVSGALHTADGIVNLPDNAYDQRIGYWVTLQATDRLRMEAPLTYPAKGKFVGNYDPDNGWQTSCTFEVADQNRREPADAYEIMRGSLLKQVLEVLKTKQECVVRLQTPQCFRQNLPVRKWIDGGANEIEPLELTLTDKIVRGIGEGRTEVTLQELQRELELYGDAAMTTQVRADVRLRVQPDTDDEIFRSTLTALGRESLGGRVFLVTDAASSGDKQFKPNKSQLDNPLSRPESKVDSP